MSIIDNLLVLFDDQKLKSIKEVQTVYHHFSKQVLASTLGRLISKGWIKKSKNQCYQITTEGRKIVSSNLTNLSDLSPNNIKKSLKSYFIMFNIPEKNRLYRDILRSFLQNNGFGLLHNTVWLSIKNSLDQTVNLVNQLGVKKYVIIFSAKIETDQLNELIHKTNWNFSKINKEYTDFISQSTKFFQNQTKQIIDARNLTYQYAKIVKSDPLLPKKFYPNNFLASKAYLIYESLRKHCY